MNKAEETIEIERGADCDAPVGVVAVCECVRERNGVYGRSRDGKCVCVCVCVCACFLVEGREEGTNESRGDSEIIYRRGRTR